MSATPPGGSSPARGTATAAAPRPSAPVAVGIRPWPASASTPAQDLLHRFQEAVARHPWRDAVVAADGTTVGFGTLDGRARRLAAALVGAGVGPGQQVGVALGREPDLVVALLAVWRVSAAYVPLDPAHPQARLDDMIEDAGIRVVVSADPAQTWPDGVRTVAPDASALFPVPDVPVPADAPAYVIYTSGSTGRPKGVCVTRAAAARLVATLEESGCYSDRPARVAWNASVSFDASVQQWARVCRGDTLLLLSEDQRADPAALAAHLLREGATDLDVTPSHWSVLRDRVVETAGQLPDGLRLFVGGEAIPAPMWQDLAGLGARGVVHALNLYGPTECTVDSTAGRVEGAEPHIGPPLPGVGAHVLDEALHPATEGELYLTGPAVALGYLRRTALTAERFTASPFGPPGSRMYRTGDRVRRRPDGSLACLGRVDHQVKVNGLRIELGEIEAVLTDHPSVSAAVAVVREDDRLGRVLAAYWVPAPGADTDPEPLRRHLGSRLPAHMAQLSLTALGSLPLGVGGKVDRTALPAPAEQQHEPDGAGAAPAGELETLIAGAWQDVLGRERVLATDDFFALGGHSLLALRVIADLKKRRGVVIPTRMVYQHPRLRDLARAITDRSDR
ncbi:non-ribosomal peptide synthetase [Streptomyces cinnabarinus]|uniref:Non-ribosomal peptide synthetase n=1 Tax=Streptomyces cinnabarinus TaxID=67287 RepID=A0ABY7KA01_9ACTN|nr:non-ribosomal peptide synthetase [Streptomyces cinnabarinus]WAZ19957.1 non-ribosomal peptide synthetase [Streptomyces cinnabarinus]